MQVERLTPDYLASTWATTGATSGVLPQGNEAPALFSRGGVWHALVADSCCYCGSGSFVRSFAAPSPLGPYVYAGDLAEGPNPFGPWDVCTSSQQTNVFAVPSPSGGEPTYLWQGDRWQSGPPPGRLKGDDFTMWLALTFDGAGNVSHFAWVDAVTVDV